MRCDWTRRGECAKRADRVGEKGEKRRMARRHRPRRGRGHRPPPGPPLSLAAECWRPCLDRAAQAGRRRVSRGSAPASHLIFPPALAPWVAWRTRPEICPSPTRSPPSFAQTVVRYLPVHLAPLFPLDHHVRASPRPPAQEGRPGRLPFSRERQRQLPR